MTIHTPRARCRCHANETTLLLCDQCLKEIRARRVPDMSPTPRNGRFLLVAAAIILGCSIAMHFVGGAW
jgi:hypothetical protein